MSDLKELLKNLSANIEISTICYVHYDPNDGRIEKISTKNVSSENFAILEVQYDSVKDILNGTKKTENFVVIYDISLKQHALRELSYESELDTVEHLLHELPTFRATSSSLFEHVYDGVEVDVWLPNRKYLQNSLVWYRNNVYKLLQDTFSEKFPNDVAEVFIEDVLITNVKSNFYKNIKKSIFTPVFTGIHVDVWYDKLRHLKGQHVWHNNCVYKLLNNQEKDTEFNKNNVELILENVKLYNDENTSLKFDQNLIHGDYCLDNNNLFLFEDSTVENLTQDDKFVKMIFFHVSDFEIIVFDSEIDKFVSMTIIEKDDTMKLLLEPTEIDIEMIVPSTSDAGNEIGISNELPKGQKVLVERKIYEVHNLKDSEYEIHLQQNYLEDRWEIFLNPSTKRSMLKSNFFGNDMLFFSITEKHDPNVLYRSLSFNIRELISNESIIHPFKYKWEFDKKDVSIYTPKFFKNYIHEILE